MNAPSAEALPWPDRLRRQQRHLRERPSLVIDADVHLTPPEACSAAMRERARATPDYFHGRPLDAAELLAEMDLAGVDLALVWQNPAATAYGDDPVANAAALRAANVAVAAAASARPDRFLAAGWTDPRALGVEAAIDLVRVCARELGLPIIKLNPAQNAYPLDHDDVLRVVDAIVAEGATPAFHYGADSPFTPPEALERVARRVAPRPVIAVHGGGGGASYVDQETMAAESRALFLRQSNLFYVHSAKRDTHMASDILAFAERGPDAWHRLALGSDVPYGRMAWNFAGARALVEHLADARHPDQARRPRPVELSADHVADYLGGNAARFLGRTIDTFLRHQTGHP